MVAQSVGFYSSVCCGKSICSAVSYVFVFVSEFPVAAVSVLILWSAINHPGVGGDKMWTFETSAVLLIAHFAVVWAVRLCLSA